MYAQPIGYKYVLERENVQKNKKEWNFFLMRYVLEQGTLIKVSLNSGQPKTMLPTMKNKKWQWGPTRFSVYKAPPNIMHMRNNLVSPLQESKVNHHM